MQGGKTQILRLVARKKPPLIGIAYQTPDQKKKVYTILLLGLIRNPSIDSIVTQLYSEHPHMLKQDKIPKQKVANLVRQIQHDLIEDGEEDEDQDEKLNYQQEGNRQLEHQHQDFDFDDEDDHPQLNRST